MPPAINTKLVNMTTNSANAELVEQLLVLLTLCKLGDKLAFEQIYQLVSAKLNGIAYRITGNIDNANSVLAETFIQLWKNREDFQAHKSDPFVWLASIVRYRAYEKLTAEQQQTTIKARNNVDIDSFYNAFGEFDPINTAKEALNNCLAKLEQKQSQAILMAYLYGYQPTDIAAYFSVTNTTAKSWLKRGLTRLQLCLNR